jgi:hypothetical protein
VIASRQFRNAKDGEVALMLATLGVGTSRFTLLGNGLVNRASGDLGSPTHGLAISLGAGSEAPDFVPSCTRQMRLYSASCLLQSTH